MSASWVLVLWIPYSWVTSGSWLPHDIHLLQLCSLINTAETQLGRKEERACAQCWDIPLGGRAQDGGQEEGMLITNRNGARPSTLPTLCPHLVSCTQPWRISSHPISPDKGRRKKYTPPPCTTNQSPFCLLRSQALSWLCSLCTDQRWSR